MFDLAVSILRLLEGARGPRVFRPFYSWHGYIDGVRYGFVRLFQLPLKPLDQYGFPKQGWVWGAQMRLSGDTLYIEGAREAPPIAGLRPLLLEADALGARWLTLDRLRGNEVVTKIYDLRRILGPKTQDDRRDREAVESRSFQADGISVSDGLKAVN